MADDNNNSSGNSAFGWIVLLIIVLIIAWFLFARGGSGRSSDVNVDLGGTVNQLDGGAAGDSAGGSGN